MKTIEQKNCTKNESVFCTGLVLKKNADIFTIQTQNGEVVDAKARKNLKKDGVFVGDRVILDEKGAVSGVQKRKNLLVRPPLANLDRLFIVVAPAPKPDFYTVDKLLVFCAVHGIKPILCINKSDLSPQNCQEIEKMYQKFVKTLIVSSFDETVQNLKAQIVGVCALAGQSAVGKSSIINALKKQNLAQVGDFSKKIQRGKQTTRMVQLYKFGKNKFLADTAGFSKLSETLLDIDGAELKKYYPEFLRPAAKCKYLSCNHLSAKDCGVAAAVKNGEICKRRYENYLKIYENLKSLKKY